MQPDSDSPGPEESTDPGEMPVFSKERPEELLQWLTLSLNQLRHRSGRMGQNASMVDKLLSSLKGLRLVGYAMAALVVLNFLSLLLDAQIMNPAWEWTFFGTTVERSAVLMMGVALVLLGHENLRGNLERYFLQLVYWGSLFAGMAYLLMLPLGVANNFRLSEFYQQQYQSNFSTIERQFQQVAASIEQAAEKATAEESEVAAARETALANAATEASRLKRNAEQQLLNQRAQLRRQSITWFSGGTLVGIVFLVLWHQARWVRRCKPKPVIFPWLKAATKKIDKALLRAARAARPTKKKATKATAVSQVTAGPGATPGLKPMGRRQQHYREKDADGDKV